MSEFRHHDAQRHFAQTRPDTLAIAAYGRAPLSHAGLARQMADMGTSLDAAGYGRESRIAAVLPQGPEQAVALFGLMAHGIAVPMAPGLRARDYETRLRQLNVDAVLWQPGYSAPVVEAAKALSLPVMTLTPDRDAPAGTFDLSTSPAPRPTSARGADPDNIALILTTSGTTGSPKVVPLSHLNLETMTGHLETWLEITPEDRVMSVMPYHHLHGLAHVFLAVIARGGGVLCCEGYDPTRFYDLFATYRPTILNSAPAVHLATMDAAKDHPGALQDMRVRLIFTGSAPMASEAIAGLEQTFNAPLLEGYGLTETSASFMINPLRGGPRKLGSVGVSIGSDVELRDLQGNAVPQGTIGEVCVRGPCVMRGYENNPEANAEAFFGAWVRTGDLGHFDEDGYLFLSGRLKEMINRGGEKIAPRDIDEVLRGHPGVVDAAAFAVPHPRLGEDIGVAIERVAGSALDTAEIRAYASAHLPIEQRPGAILFLENIPRNASGKVVRPALAALCQSIAPENDLGDLPETAMEQAVADIWEQVFDVAPIGRMQDFFALGGDSLTAAAIAALISDRFQITLTGERIFDIAPNIASMARVIDLGDARMTQARDGGPDGALVSGPVPLSATQESAWVASRLFADEPLFQVPGAVRLTGPLDVDRLRAALVDLAGLHPALQLKIRSDQGKLVQDVGAPDVSVKLTKDGASDTWARAELARPLDLRHGPLWRVAVLSETPQQHLLLLVAHHAIVDGVSMEILLEDLQDLLTGGDVTGPKGAFVNFAAWQRRQIDMDAFTPERRFWRMVLTGMAAPLELPLSRPRPERPSYGAGHVVRQLDTAMATQVSQLGQRTRCTPFMVLLAAFAVAMRQSGTDLTVGVPLANRPGAAFERSVGCFTNTVPFRMDLSGDPGFATLLERVRQVTLSATANGAVPLEVIAQDAGLHPGAPGVPLLPVGFQLNGTTTLPMAPNFVPLFDVLVEWMPGSDGLLGRISYRKDLFDAGAIQAVFDAYLAVLDAALADPDAAISAIL